MIKLTYKQIKNPVFAQVDTKDYPDFCDAYIESAEYPNGEPIPNDLLQDLESEIIHELLFENLF